MGTPSPPPNEDVEKIQTVEVKKSDNADPDLSTAHPNSQERRDEPSATENVQENSEKNVQGATERSDSHDVAGARGTSSNGSGTRSADIRNSTGAKPAKSQRSSKTTRQKSEKEERRPRKSKKEGQVDSHGGAAKRDSKGGPRESTRSKRKSRESEELRALKEKYERKRKSKKGSIDVGDDLKEFDNKPYDPNRPKTTQQKIFHYIAVLLYFLIPCLLVITVFGYTALKEEKQDPVDKDISEAEEIYLKCFLYEKNSEMDGLETEDKFMCSMYPIYKIVK